MWLAIPMRMASPAHQSRDGPRGLPLLMPPAKSSALMRTATSNARAACACDRPGVGRAFPNGWFNPADLKCGASGRACAR